MLKNERISKKRLTRQFFTHPTLKVCRDVLGKYLVCKIGNKKIVGKIVEVEAYIGPNDRASHAIGGKMTERNRAEFLEGGYVYIYLVYGMYWQFNVSTSKKGSPECFLIRALEPIAGAQNQKPRRRASTLRGRSKIKNKNDILKIKDFTNGPGKLCRWMKLDKGHYGLDLTTSRKLWIEDWGERVSESQVVRAGRVGIDYAGKYWARKRWRFYIKGNPCVSRL